MALFEGTIRSAVGTVGAVAHSVAEPVKHVAGHESAHVVSKGLTEGVRGAFTGLGPSAGTIIGLGLTSGVVAAITQGEYNAKRREIIAVYKDELSAKLGKPHQKIKHKDVKEFAEGNVEKGLEGNRTIAQALSKARKERNIGIATSVLASMVSYGVLSLAFPGFVGATAAAVGVELAAHGIGHMIAQGVAGFLMYTAVRKPLNWVGQKMFKVGKATAHERIAEMQKDRDAGKTITRDRVFDIFVCVDHELDHMVKKAHGRHFHRLPTEKQEEIMDSIGKMIRLNEITAAINNRQMDPTELAFAVDGQESGYKPGLHMEQPQRTGVLATIKRLLFGKDKQAAPESSPVIVAAAVQASEPTPLTERQERKPAADMSHVERLERQRAENSLLLQR